MPKPSSTSCSIPSSISTTWLSVTVDHLIPAIIGYSWRLLVVYGHNPDKWSRDPYWTLTHRLNCEVESSIYNEQEILYIMHLLVDTDTLARVVSSKLSGNETAWTLQEECGVSETTSFLRLVNMAEERKVIVGVTTPSVEGEWNIALLRKKFDQNVSFLKYAS
ncbi:12990_t:CDS:2, partial [Acaulospora colombiana]